MNIQEIKTTTLQAYIECGVRTFPIDCSAILAHYHFSTYSYSFLQKKNEELYRICAKYSEDAFTYGTIICYNDKMPRERVRFSLMHELGHHLLNTDSEVEANQFASHFLAPRCILLRSGLTDTRELSQLFQISKQAAAYALKDVSSLKVQTGKSDRQILEHFYDPARQIIVYHISECPVCGSVIYNSVHNTCIQCKKLSIKSR